MTDLSAEQNAMLERLCRTLMISCTCPDCLRQIKYAMRKLLLAVQERSAEAVRMNECGKDEDGHSCHEDDARVIRAQRYADLFLKEE